MAETSPRTLKEEATLLEAFLAGCGETFSHTPTPTECMSVLEQLFPGHHITAECMVGVACNALLDEITLTWNAFMYSTPTYPHMMRVLAEGDACENVHT